MQQQYPLFYIKQESLEDLLAEGLRREKLQKILAAQSIKNNTGISQAQETSTADVDWFVDVPPLDKPHSVPYEIENNYHQYINRPNNYGSYITYSQGRSK
jgi:hypothetical protein